MKKKRRKVPPVAVEFDGKTYFFDRPMALFVCLLMFGIAFMIMASFLDAIGLNPAGQ